MQLGRQARMTPCLSCLHGINNTVAAPQDTSYKNSTWVMSTISRPSIPKGIFGSQVNSQVSHLAIYAEAREACAEEIDKMRWTKADRSYERMGSPGEVR